MVDQFDVLIRNGSVVDGTGNPFYKADIGIEGGRIVHIHRDINPDGAKHLIDATGLTVSPGFIDVHSHDDVFGLVKPTADEKVLQGVTTVVVVNCGVSLGPMPKEWRAEFQRLLFAFGEVDFSGVDTFRDYL